MIESDAPVADDPRDEVLETYTNPDGIICRIVKSKAGNRIDRWFNGNGKDHEAKWLQWLQSGETNEILHHRKEKEKLQKDFDDLKVAHDALFVENEALKSKKP